MEKHTYSDQMEYQWKQLQMYYPYKLLKKLGEGPNGVLY